MVKRLKIISNIFFVLAIIALAVGASFHGYRIHPENVPNYKLGVAMGISMIAVLGVCGLAGIICRVIAKAKSK